MAKYVVNFIDAEKGYSEPIDNIVASDDYTAEQYIADCESNADEDWVEMLHSGTVELEKI